MKSTLSKYLRYEPWVSCLLIALVGLLAYTPLMNRLGYYKEDWIVVWAGVTQGPQALISVFSVDRPLLGYLFALIYPALGNDPLSWQIYAFFIRLIGVYALFGGLRILWPKEKLSTTILTLLFFIYPGFLQQPQANIFQGHFTALAFAILSITLTLLSIRTKNLAGMIGLTFIAAIMAVIYPSLMEYYIGLEGLRALLVWYYLRRDSTQKLRKDIQNFLLRISPYILAAGVYLYWRLFIYESPRPTTDVNRLLTTYLTNRLEMVMHFFIELVRDTFETTILAWFTPLEQFLYWGSYQEALVGAILVLVAIALVGAFYLFMKRMQFTESETGCEGMQKALVWIGGLATIFALIPLIAADQDMNFLSIFSRSDRFSLPVAIGAVFVAYGLIASLLQPRFRIWAVVLLTGIAIASHYQHALYMRDLWEIQRQVWWQLSWRAPEIQQKTLLLVDLPANFEYAGDAEIWAAANLVYYRQPGPPPVNADTLVQQTVFQIQQGGRKTRTYRSVWLNKNYNNPLVMSMPTPKSCLNVIDGRKYELSRQEDPLVRAAAPYSKIDRIITDVPFTQPPLDIFGPEPAHTWCYYYQKAMYARQIGNWKEIAQLADEAQSKGFGTTIPSEWMPFLEGYASAGRDKDAKRLASIIGTDIPVKNTICNQLLTPPIYPGNYDYEKVVAVLCSNTTE